VAKSDIGRKPRQATTLAGGLRVQGRVLNGLVLRELASRFGRRGTGMLFTFIVPLAQSSIIAGLRVLAGVSGYAGMAVFPFTACGVLFYRGWRNTSGAQIDAVQASLGLLYVHHVTTLDLHLSRFIVDMSINLAVGAIMYFLVRLVGLSPPADEPLYLILLLMLANVLGLGWGLMLAGVSVYLPVVKGVNMIISRFLYFASGIFFVVPELPPGIREYLLWNPLLHITELARSYYFVQYTTAYGHLDYVLVWTIALLFVGLVLERLLRDEVQR